MSCHEREDSFWHMLLSPRVPREGGTVQNTCFERWIASFVDAGVFHAAISVQGCTGRICLKCSPMQNDERVTADQSRTVLLNACKVISANPSRPASGYRVRYWRARCDMKPPQFSTPALQQQPRQALLLAWHRSANLSAKCLSFIAHISRSYHSKPSMPTNR